uniref:FH2 domain-containing protein n=1 Tax=Cyprinus carpio TaxID=7962 RepID=A0A8C1YXV9_CYPCA
MSLLDYIVSYYLRHLDKVKHEHVIIHITCNVLFCIVHICTLLNAGTEKSIFPLPEPQDVFLSSQVKFDDLSKDLKKMNRDLTVCEKDVLTVCTNSSHEHIHPFKEKMECFIANGDFASCLSFLSFSDLVEYFGLKPRSGEQEIVPGHVFTLWFEFCNDFKIRWKRENKVISKESMTTEKKIETRKAHANGLVRVCLHSC